MGGIKMIKKILLLAIFLITPLYSQVPDTLWIVRDTLYIKGMVIAICLEKPTTIIDSASIVRTDSTGENVLIWQYMTIYTAPAILNYDVNIKSWNRFQWRQPEIFPIHYEIVPYFSKGKLPKVTSHFEGGKFWINGDVVTKELMEFSR